MPVRNETLLVSIDIRLDIDNAGQILHQRDLQEVLLFVRVKDVQRGIFSNDGTERCR